MIDPAEIHAFWFGTADGADAVPADRTRFWFGGDAKTDELIRLRYHHAVARALDGAFAAWAEEPLPSLSLILLLDQFPRNIYRNDPMAFAGDGRARTVCLHGLDKSFDRTLAVAERAFFYMPLEHAEDLTLQDRSVELFRSLRDAAPAAQQTMCESFYDYALRHRDIIARFGRFPHRNAILGRESTPEETEFLRQPGSSF